MTEKVKIMHVFASRSWGGGEQYVYDLCEQLVKDDYSVVMVSKKSDAIKAKTAPLGLQLYTLPMNGISDIRSPFALRRIIRKEGVQIVHIHHFKDAAPLMLTKLLVGGRVKIVLTRHLVRKGKTGRLYKMIYAALDKIIFVSDLAREVFLSTNPPVDKTKITVVHNSIPEKVTTSEINYREHYNIPVNATVLTFIGRLHPEKGIEVLLEALAKFKRDDYMVLIAGTGDEQYKSRLKGMVDTLGLSQKIIFTGFVSDVPQLASQTDIGVLPSIGRESFLLVTLDFFRWGVPVISTDNGGQVEVIKDNQTGILVPPSDPDKLSEAILTLLNDPELRKKIGATARRSYTEEFSYDIFYKRITEIYSELSE